MRLKGQVQSSKVHPVLKIKTWKLTNRCDFSKIDRLSFLASMKSIYIQRIKVRYQSVLGILKITEYPYLIGQEHAYSGISIQS